jgi:hypothetical protein
MGSPRGVVYDTVGNLYIADARNHQVDRISAAGVLTVFAGTGAQGFAGDGSPAITAELNSPTALALGADGGLLIADTGNHRVRRVAVDGTIRTIAGTGVPGRGGEGELASAARLRSPSGVAFGPDGSLYIADTGNHCVRRLTPNGMLTTVAGSGEDGDRGDGGSALLAGFRAPGALQMLPDGRLLIADAAAHRIRALLPDGTITAYAASATLLRPEGLATDATGSLLIADAATHQLTRSGTDSTTVLTASTVAGSGMQGSPTVGAPTETDPTETDMDTPTGVATDTSGNIAISDRRNHQVQRITLPSLSFGDVPAGQSSIAQSVTLENGGTDPLSIAALQLPDGFTAAAVSNACPAFPFTLRPAATCNLGITFVPVAQGSQNGMAQVLLTGAPPAPVRLTGNGTATGALAQSVTALTSNGSISFAGSPVSLSVTVSGLLQAQPAGNVTFYDGTSPMATIVLAASSATMSTASMQQGQHTLHATYSGDANYAASNSASIIQNVVRAPDFTISAGAASYSGRAGGTITVPLSFLPVDGTLNHTMQLAVTGLPSGAVATFTPSVFTLGADAAHVSLTISMPATIVAETSRGWTLSAAGLLLLAFLPKRRLRRHGLLLMGLAALLSAGGCGGGFRTTTTTTGTPTRTYSAVVTASTTGVLGNPLTHSTAINLVVTP